MIVYRLEVTGSIFEGEVGTGVHYAEAARAVCSDSCDTSHPTPTEESTLKDIFDDTYVCCFDNLSELRRWFDTIDDVTDPEEIAAYQISIYSIPEEWYHRGRWQSIAKAKHMVRVETHTLHYRG